MTGQNGIGYINGNWTAFQSWRCGWLPSKGRAGAREDACPRESRGEPLLDSRPTPVERQTTAGTMPQKVRGWLSHPSTTWLTWMYTFLATGGTPKRAV